MHWLVFLGTQTKFGEQYSFCAQSWSLMQPGGGGLKQVAVWRSQTCPLGQSWSLMQAGGGGGGHIWPGLQGTQAPF